jgi:hypothetical protein
MRIPAHIDPPTMRINRLVLDIGTLLSKASRTAGNNAAKTNR